MTHMSRVIRRPLAVAAAGGLLGVLGLGGSALAAAPKTQHRHATHHAAKHHGRDHGHGHGHGHGGNGMRITSAPWDAGAVPGQSAPVNLYTLTSSGGMQVKISNYGGVVQSIWVPDRSGHLTNVALGFPHLLDYYDDFTQGATGTPFPAAGGSGDTYFGAIIGRYANRIGQASFSLNGQTYKLDANNGPNTLHGGYLGWNTRVWSASTSTAGDGSVSLVLTADFPAGEGCLPAKSPGCTGFPAAVRATVTYTLTRDNQLKIGYVVVNRSSSDATVINLTNHTYFNLGGEGGHTVYNQLLALNSDAYTPVDVNLIPEAPYFVPVNGTAYDFRHLHPIGQNIRNTNLPDGESGPLKQLQIAHGYDNNWVLNGSGYRLAAVAQDTQNGITLQTFTTEPGIQVYTGNFLVGDLIGSSGNVYRQGDAFTLETQHYPDAPHHIGQAGWPSVVLNPNATFNSTTAFKFSVAGGGHGGHVRRVRFR
jgi:aldose 1-epimerase